MSAAVPLTLRDVEMAIGTALKPVFRRIVALERDSHPPVDLAPFIQEEIARALSALPH